VLPRSILGELITRGQQQFVGSERQGDALHLRDLMRPHKGLLFSVKYPVQPEARSHKQGKGVTNQPEMWTDAASQSRLTSF
jgi:hypothetical protein